MDFISFGILLVLILLFGFLAYRAWGSKNAILKWVGLVLAGLLTLIFALVFILAVSGAMKFNQNYNASHPASDVKVAMTPDNLARGKQIAALCTGCHGDNGNFPLKGNDFTAGGPPFGTLWAANLTPAGEISGWTDGQVIRAIREGVHKSGRPLIIMPANAFRNMSDTDVQALVSYLRSQAPVEPANPPAALNLVGNIFASGVMGEIFTVQPHITQPVVSPPPGVSAEYGQYLVSFGGCRDCHGENLAGGAVPGGDASLRAPNITLVIPKWTQEQFHTFFRTGVLPNGTSVSENMPWAEYNRFASDDDLKAMFAYLHALAPAQEIK